MGRFFNTETNAAVLISAAAAAQCAFVFHEQVETAKQSTVTNRTDCTDVFCAAEAERHTGKQNQGYGS